MTNIPILMAFASGVLIGFAFWEHVDNPPPFPEGVPAATLRAQSRAPHIA